MGPPYGSPPWGPQQPPGPPKRGSGLKWVLGGVVLLVVVAVTVGATLLFTGGGSGHESSTNTSSPTTSGVASDFASANDNGPVKIITEDPTCAPWGGINDTLASRQERNGWSDRDPSIPAVTWSPEMRKMFTEAGDAMTEAADQAVPLVTTTPHRVIRELYEQFIAYARAYDERLPTYEATDNHLANVAVAATYVLTNICNTVESGSAVARGPLVSPTKQPTTLAPLGDPAKPERFLTSSDAVCPEWAALVTKINANTVEWANTDPSVPVDQWSPEQKALAAAVTPVLQRAADDMQSLSTRADNPVLQDFAALAAMYQRADLQALPTYSPADQYLYTTAAQAAVVVSEACLAAGG
jgi:hypothetical protein